MRAWAWIAGALVGCGGAGGDGPDGPGGPDGEVTWHGQVAPIVAQRCGDCHYDGGPGPFDARDVEQVESWAPAMLAAIEAGRMPPFAARSTEDCAPEAPIKDDGSLRDEERAALEAWVAADYPRGDPENAAPVPARRPTELEDPDVVLTLPEPFTVGGTQDIYRCFRIPVPTDGDRWITGMQVTPDNDKVVHHVLVWTDPYDQSLAEAGPDGSYPCAGDPDVFPTELVGIWTPGGTPMRTPEGTGVTLRNGSTLVVNIHYHPTGNSTEIDQSSVALTWTEQRPEQFATWYLVDLPFGAEADTPPFQIPAGESHHVEDVVLTNPIPFEVPIFAVAPHMHYLGTGMQVTIEAADGGRECLVNTPQYRFDFQQSYYYDVPIDDMPVLRFGDKVRVRCTYDNSMSNPFMADAMAATGADGPVTVTWGEQTADEMCMAMTGLISPFEILNLLENF